jgi:hypothetical protein
MLVYVYYGHLVYFTANWSILRLIGIGILCLFDLFYGYLVYLSTFWYVVPRKIWQPCPVSDQFIDIQPDKLGKEGKVRTGESDQQWVSSFLFSFVSVSLFAAARDQCYEFVIVFDKKYFRNKWAVLTKNRVIFTNTEGNWTFLFKKISFSTKKICQNRRKSCLFVTLSPVERFAEMYFYWNWTKIWKSSVSSILDFAKPQFDL